MNRASLAVLLLVIAGPALAQGHQPYAGLQHRTVKALSQEQIDDLRAGRGMGLALAAELNGYPGPLHVLEHAEALGLSAEQRERTNELHQQMKNEAIPLGERLIEQETQLDRLFAEGEITPERLAALTEEIGVTQARLRNTHLKYHLAMMDVLSSDQVSRYRELRGYAAQHGGGGHHGGGQHQPPE